MAVPSVKFRHIACLPHKSSLFVCLLSLICWLLRAPRDQRACVFLKWLKMVKSQLSAFKLGIKAWALNGDSKQAIKPK
jgi:hypothetical protein